MSDFFDAIDVSASALSAERLRMNTISSNLANAQTTRTPEGGPYRRKDPVFEAVPTKDFASVLQNQMEVPLHKVKVVDVVSDTGAPKMVYQPSHPDANEEGYVAMPNVNTVEEMVNLITASRTYEANVKALNVTQNMMNRALDIGRR
ncbi:MAG: flagellar basal body rod protein FlgC [Deltaproteobacteria bacterium]|nr:flagellar basal body rod protein FlgC [Deltaproteobacteria bacterium]